MKKHEHVYSTDNHEDDLKMQRSMLFEAFLSAFSGVFFFIGVCIAVCFADNIDKISHYVGELFLTSPDLATSTIIFVAAFGIERWLNKHKFEV